MKQHTAGSANHKYKTQHLSSDKDNCHSLAHLKRQFNTSWSVLECADINLANNFNMQFKIIYKTFTIIPRLVNKYQKHKRTYDTALDNSAKKISFL